MTETATPSPAQPPGTGTGDRAPGAGRDRYLDLLRTLALLRVVLYHTFAWGWLTFLFPSMGVMFALAGALMARSLARPGPALGVLRGRIRRLLLPLWLYGLVVLGVLFAQEWRPARGEEAALWWLKLAFWVVPVGTPPFPMRIGEDGGMLDAGWAQQAAGPLWYLRAYFWFVLLSPLLLKAFRALPWATLLAPLGLTAVVGTGLVEIPGATGEAVRDFAVHGACWVLGFAHHDGVLYRIPRYFAPSIGPVFMGLGLWWSARHPGPDGWDLGDIPLGQALWSFGYCLLLFQVSPAWQRLPERLRRFDGTITLANNRAVSVYLWHEIALIATVPLIDLLWRIPAVWRSSTLSGLLENSYPVLMFLLVWPLLAVLVAAFGWAEDLAARRRPRLWPHGPYRREDAGREGESREDGRPAGGGTGAGAVPGARGAVGEGSHRP
ncbi:acyltransferase family protein [Streptomyces chitinivorans]|uniref:Acyltransferase family protein n=1 Tax=Streptomyces chitinivorans TaxID=1257027 RepID=A0ABW7HYG5_9ACTN|nr:acyltransferase family protein [Streptomyces chitinivorans]MDH2410915.1 acyltransferase family protein [Streptomyces chitinivorans]